MSLTLFVENNPKIESCYRLNLSTWLGLELTVVPSLKEAFEAIEKHPDIKLIITRNVIKKEEVSLGIAAKLREKGLTIPMVTIGPGAMPEKEAWVPNSLQLQSMIRESARALGITAKDMSEKVVPDFFPISINHFKVLKRSICPVYVNHNSVYEECFGKNKEFTDADVQKLIDAGVTTLFVDKFDRLEFVNNLTSEIMMLLKDEELSFDEQLTATDKGVELLSRKLLNMGVNEETIKLANKNLASFRKNVKVSPKLSRLLEKLVANKTSYLFKHSQIMTYVGLHIVKNIDWGNADQEEKISFMAFFHDIALEKDEHAQIKSNLELKKSTFTVPEKQLIEKHAQVAAEFVSKFPHSPMGADQLIRQHHGTLNGVGFSEHFGNNVSPVAVVFILAEEFTRILMQNESGPYDKKDMLRQLRQEFPTSRFQKVIDLLETITI